MMRGTCVLILMSICMTAPAQPVSSANESVTVRVREIFAKADELAAQARQRHRDQLSAMSDEELARAYAQATAPQPQADRSSPIGPSSYHLDAVKKDRQKIIEQLAKEGAPYNWKEFRDSRDQNLDLAAEIAAMGPAVVPILFMERSHWDLTQKAISKLGSGAVEPLMAQMDSNDAQIRTMAADLLSPLGDVRAKAVLLRGVQDESPAVRKYARLGLTKLGPKVVDVKDLVRILIDGLQDEGCMWDSIEGLALYGDESAIEPLRVIERYEMGGGAPKGKASDPRYKARLAINAILQRAGKPVEQVTPEQYSDKKPTFEELTASACCSNAIIQSSAITWLEGYRDDRTSRFFIGRLTHESGPIFERLISSFATMVRQSKGTTSISPASVQEAIDTLLSMAEKSPRQGTDRRMAALHGVGWVLRTASDCQIPLKGAGRFKEIILKDLASDTAKAQAADYYWCISMVGLIHPLTGESWLPQEKESLLHHVAPLLDSPNPDSQIISCLGYIGDKRLTARLVELLGHNDSRTRLSTARTLGMIGDAQALPKLRQLSQTDPYLTGDDVYLVRQAAQKAITQIEERIKGERP